MRETWAQTAAVARKGPGAWPTDPVTLVVPFPAGGTTALLAKQLVKPFQQQTQQSLRLQYQSGAAGVQGAAYAASAPPDGKHLLMGGSNLAVARALAADDDFDLVEDLRPLALVARVPLVLLVIFACRFRQAKKERDAAPPEDDDEDGRMPPDGFTPCGERSCVEMGRGGKNCSGPARGGSRGLFRRRLRP